MDGYVNLTDTPLPYSDHQANISPYDIGKLIWKQVENYFESQYGVEITESYPKNRVTRPTITWRILRRSPGRGKNTTVTGKGANFSKYLSLQDHIISEVYSQVQTVQLEFAIFAASSTEADDLAWDFENAVLIAAGKVQEEYPSFTMTFSEQLGDGNMSWENQDDLNVRTLRFECTTHIMYTRTIPEIRRIEKYQGTGFSRLELTMTRLDDTSISYIPTDGKKVLKIHAVALFDPVNYYDNLVKGVDYEVKTDSEQVAYIEWNTTSGKIPAPGQEFRVEYSLQAQFETGRIDVTNKI